MYLYVQSDTSMCSQITACVVATNCCISDEPCQWKKANFDPTQLRHLTDRPETKI